MSDGIYKPNEAAAKIGVSVKTLQRWDRTGKLIAGRTPSNRRYYTEEQIESYFAGSGDDGGVDRDGCVDRGYILSYKWNGDETEILRDEQENPMFKIVDVATEDGDDDLYELVWNSYDVGFKMVGFEIGESTVYNALLDYVLNESDQGNENVTARVIPLLEEIDEANELERPYTTLGKIVRKYLIEILSGEDN